MSILPLCTPLHTHTDKLKQIFTRNTKHTQFFYQFCPCIPHAQTYTHATPDILAHIMHDLFGGVVYAGIDTDRYKYPIGSGRVTFGNQRSFMKAVKAGFVEIKTPKFSKKVSFQHTNTMTSLFIGYHGDISPRRSR